MPELVVIDTETSGVNPVVHNVWEIALVPLDDLKPTFHSYVSMPEETKFGSTAVPFFEANSHKWERHRISPEAAMISLERYLKESFSEDVMLVGWNVGFDVMMLKKLAYLCGGANDREGSQITGIGYRSIDLHSMLWMLVDLGIVPPSVCSSSTAFKHFGVEPPDNERHTAAGDAFAARGLFKAMRSVARFINSD